MDLAALCDDHDKDVGQWVDEVETCISQNPRQRQLESIAAGSSVTSPIWAESWFLSYVVQNTNSQHRRLYQPIINQGEDAGGSPGQRQSADISFRDGASISNRTKAIPRTNIAKNLAVRELIEGYFQTLHRFCPIIDRVSFLSSVDNGTVPTVLLQCVIFAASIHCEESLIHRLGFRSRVQAEDELFTSARNACDTDLETDRLDLLLSSYLLHYWSGAPMKAKDSTWWLAGAIRLAQAMGMHRSFQQQNQPSTSLSSTWRRIWWLLYVC